MVPGNEEINNDLINLIMQIGGKIPKMKYSERIFQKKLVHNEMKIGKI